MANGTRYMRVVKRGTRKDGQNYVTHCGICPGARQDVSGVLGVSREEALRLKEKHVNEVHYGKKTI